MKLAIVYCSKHGATEKVANLIKDGIGEYQTDLFNLLKDPEPDIREYDSVIVGGPIYFGMIQNPLKMFCKQNEKILLRKELSLFICCMVREQEDEQFENAFSEKLRMHSSAKGFFGWELQFDQLNLFEKLMVKKVNDICGGSHIDFPQIGLFVKKLRQIYSRYDYAI